MTAEERRESGTAAFERVNGMPAPPPINAFVECGVVGYVFAEVWNRGVLSDRDRRLVALCGAAAAAADGPLEAHVRGALATGDLSYEEFDELVLHVATQYGWPTASVLNGQGMAVRRRLAEERGEEPGPVAFEPPATAASPAERRDRAIDVYRSVHGAEPPLPTTPFTADAVLDHLYGEVWARIRHLDRRSRRIIAICCASVTGVDDEVQEHVRAALVACDVSVDELREIVVHLAVYAGWPRARRLDERVTAVVASLAAVDDDGGATG